MATDANHAPLKMLSRECYPSLPDWDPLHLYYWPILGRLYRRRVEMCLAQCTGGDRVFEVGFGSGVTFLNLHDLYNEIHGIDLSTKIELVSALFAGKGLDVRLCNGNVLDMPYPDKHFDTVLLISILEHLKLQDLPQAMLEIRRVLKPGGQLVYGVPVERPFMVFLFCLMGCNIREHHFSTEKDVTQAAGQFFRKVQLASMKGGIPGLGPVYQVGNFIK